MCDILQYASALQRMYDTLRMVLPTVKDEQAQEAIADNIAQYEVGDASLRLEVEALLAWHTRRIDALDGMHFPSVTAQWHAVYADEERRVKQRREEILAQSRGPQPPPSSAQ